MTIFCLLTITEDQVGWDSLTQILKFRYKTCKWAFLCVIEWVTIFKQHINNGATNELFLWFKSGTPALALTSAKKPYKAHQRATNHAASVNWQFPITSKQPSYLAEFLFPIDLNFLNCPTTFLRNWLVLLCSCSRSSGFEPSRLQCHCWTGTL